MCGGNIPDFDAARHRALGLHAQIDRHVRLECGGQDYCERMARKTDVRLLGVNAVRRARVSRRNIEPDSQALRIEGVQQGRALFIPVAGEAQAIPDTAIARRRDRGIRCRYKFAVIGPRDDLRRSRLNAVGSETVDDDRHGIRSDCRSHPQQRQRNHARPAGLRGKPILHGNKSALIKSPCQGKQDTRHTSVLNTHCSPKYTYLHFWRSVCRR